MIVAGDHAVNDMAGLMPTHENLALQLPDTRLILFLKGLG